MAGTRKRHPAAFKAKVALEAARQTRTVAELARTYQVHPVRISQGKTQLLDGAETLSRDGRRRDREEGQALQAGLYERIGRLNMEVEGLKKGLPASVDPRRAPVHRNDDHWSICRRCEPLGLNRSTYYLPPATESGGNLRRMRRLDEQDLKAPFYGSRRRAECSKRAGEAVNRKRVRRLMAVMGLEARPPKPRATAGTAGAKAHPYLLRDRVLTRVDEVWGSDIPSVPMRHGFMDLTAVIAWYSRYVLAWRLSSTLDGGFCLEALDEAWSRGRPEIFNTDPGSQFTSREYAGRLEAAGVAVSRDGRGRAPDDVFVERLRGSVKYEDIYIKDYEDVSELESGLMAYFRSYDEDRPHQSLDDRTPGEVDRAGIRGALNGGGS